MQLAFSIKMVVIVLGIGGVSRSGKSSLSQRLCSELNISPSNKFNVDDYLIEPISVYDSKLNEIIKDWDHKDAYNISRMELEAINQVELLKKNTTESTVEYVIFEGWLLFSIENLVKLCNLKFMIDINKEEAYSRRLSTNKIGNRPDVFKYYFEEYLWKRFIEYK